MYSSKKQKVVSFYGRATPRPTLLLDKDHEPIKNRVDAPEPITGALIEWAKAVPESRGGARPTFKNAPRACLTAFGALVQEKRKELQQGEMHNYYSSETRSLQLDARTAALQDWKLFSDADKAVYQAQAADDQERWEAEVEDFEKRFPHYRSYLAQKHQKKLNVKGAIDIKLTQLGIKKPCTARHFFIKEQVEKRLKENEALALEFTAMELFEAASVAKGQDWADMADKQKYEELAEDDKERFQAQLKGHPKLQQMIKAYEQKQQELKTINATKKGPSKTTKKRKRSTKEEADSDAEEVQGDDASAQHAQEQQADMPHADDAALEEAQPQICVTADVSKVNAVAAAPKDAADEPVSDTDDDIEDHAFEPEEPQEIIAETQNDEDALVTAGSQVSTGKKRLGIDQFRSFFAGLFTGKKNKNKPSDGQGPSSQPTQDSMNDDLPPLQNTLGSQAEVAVGSGAEQSLAEMLQDVADMDAAAAAPNAVPAAETADNGVALVTQPESASQMPATQTVHEEEMPPTQDTALGTAASGIPTAFTGGTTVSDARPDQQDHSRGAAASDAMKAPTQDTLLGTGGKEEEVKATQQSEASLTGTSRAMKRRTSSASNKENKSAKSPKRNSPRAEAAPKSPNSAHPADRSAVKSSGKEPTSDVKSKGTSVGSGSAKKESLLGRCIKKDFETDNGVKAFTGWIIGLHSNKKWYAVQYEDGDTEELLVSELKRKKLLQPAGPQDRTDFAELDRLYAAAKLQWAKEEDEEAPAK